MTDTALLAKGFALLAEGYQTLALAYSAPAGASAPAPAGTPPPPLHSVPDDEEKPEVCPAHGKPFIDGNYGPYCPSQSDDPAWANAKGYCNIKPKNVAVWLRTHA